MSNNLIVGFSGNTSRPSSTKRFVENVSEALAGQLGLQHQFSTSRISGHH